ncbi:hypothetical protein GUJ93_ZPchr0009g1462 [Zizania palustris]|uniref:Uncharacterized protein n=1 Tax=Zizania palustris TaxID=103762 RepID=A0A8J5RSD1_ZIZPA|nr:hypothetical protein GUJ93_ZPchr0009g1462 [Zizania palustris]
MSGKYREALEHCNIVYEKNPWRTDNLLLLGAIYYQIRNYDMCIAKNTKALAIDPNFAKGYGIMENGDVDLAIRYCLIVIQGHQIAGHDFTVAYIKVGREFN